MSATHHRGAGQNPHAIRRDVNSWDWTFMLCQHNQRLHSGYMYNVNTTTWVHLDSWHMYNVNKDKPKAPRSGPPHPALDGQTGTTAAEGMISWYQLYYNQWFKYPFLRTPTELLTSVTVMVRIIIILLSGVITEYFAIAIKSLKQSCNSHQNITSMLP